MPTFIFIHPTVWTQYTNVTERTDNGLIAEGEPFYKRSPKMCYHSLTRANLSDLEISIASHVVIPASGVA